jgi:2-iminoacetate synthase
LTHVEHLERTHGVGPHTISVPRLEPAIGVDLSKDFPHQVSDDDFMRLVAILRLSVPYTGLILSTRESASLRDELFALGISQVSAGSKTSPGGYAHAGDEVGESQFVLGDRRDLDSVIGSLLSKGLMPSFCAACYRKERTGEAFMRLARPGTIKGMCQMNALITLKEYLDDFASPGVRAEGYRLIEKCRGNLDDAARHRLAGFFADIEKGIRDIHV